MRQYLLPLIALSLLTLSFSHADDKPNDTAAEKLQGRWEIVAGVNQGRKLSQAEVEGTYVTIVTNKMITYDRDNQARYQAIFDVDEQKTPLEITMRALGENAATALKKVNTQPGSTGVAAGGILKFESDNKWVLCYALPGADRPKEFASPKGSKIMLFTLERKQVDPVPVSSAKQ